jgi:alpha-tubulin suppressor-like RCC1 family protein
VTQICGGHGHTLALTAEGHVYTFGSSVFGQLGNGSSVKSSVPVHVTALTERITIIATNYFHNVSTVKRLSIIPVSIVFPDASFTFYSP